MTQGTNYEVVDLLYDIASRLIVVITLLVYGIFHLSYLSNEADRGGYTQSEIATIDTVFGVLAISLVVYAFLPMLKYGYRNRETTEGKLSIGAALITCVFSVITIFL